MFNMLGLGVAHRNDEFLTNFIVDQGTEKFLKEAKGLGFDAKTAAIYVIRECLVQLRVEHEQLPYSITSQIDDEVVQTLTDALAAIGVSLEDR